MKLTFDEFDPLVMSPEDRRTQLGRYEFLAEFVMCYPDCATQLEQQELFRRIDLLLQSSTGDSGEGEIAA